jgi:hypothetical protein
LLSSHELESLEVGQLRAQLLGVQSLRPGALGPLLVNLSLVPGLQEGSLAHSVLDLEHVLGQVEALQVQDLARDVRAINENLEIMGKKIDV